MSVLSLAFANLWFDRDNVNRRIVICDSMVHGDVGSVSHWNDGMCSAGYWNWNSGVKESSFGLTTQSMHCKKVIKILDFEPFQILFVYSIFPIPHIISFNYLLGMGM